MYFKSFLTTIDALFDTLYAIFPLFLIIGEMEIKPSAAAAVLHADSFLFYISVWYPMTLLSYKIYRIFLYLTRSARKEWIKHYQTKNIDFTLNKQVSKITDVGQNNIMLGPLEIINEQSISTASDQSPTNNKIKSSIKQYMSICCYGNKYLEFPLPDYKLRQSELIIQIIRRLFITIFGFCLFLYGIILMSLTISHINNAKDICNTFTSDNPELYVWDYCNFKVYPILNGNDIPCNCRGLRINQTSFANLNQTRFNRYSLERMLEKWFMLESMLKNFSN